ncbi:hypothetical protein DFJ58DRAFT_863192 [Suillus subalutaceus]|uniref:uncharacterized protein n=1 Tax=Suillus subalutaceus TaxID=48586 RepID=UPI001B86C95B|nr:uncharacterized protein DFJ58DRAFT_863192 [Suillus subalutaceus]KAG1837229.1 hypothetical protein DFJ58DRAFT_863192 [Suillus subalutaceus]
MSPADCLEYLDLHGQTKHYFKIRLTAEFVFEKRPGMFCWFPTTKTTVLSSEPIKCEIARTMLEKIHTDFSCSVVHQVCRNWFNWNTVKLPPKMLQRLAASQQEELECKCQTQDMSTSSYIFPNPLSSPAILSVLSPQSSAVSTQPDDDWRYSLSMDASLSSGHFSLTSDCSSLHSLSDEDTDKLSKTTELLAEGITIRTNRPLITQLSSTHTPKTITGRQTPTSTYSLQPPALVAASPRLKNVVSSPSHSAVPVIQNPPPSPPPFIVAPCSPCLKYSVSSPSASCAALPHTKSNTPPSPPFIVAPCSPRLKHSVSSPLAPCAVPSHVKSSAPQLADQIRGASGKASRQRSKVENQLENQLENPVQISTSMRGTEQDSHLTGCPNDADSENISMEIRGYLQDLSLHAITMDEIWRCIDQVDGYGPLNWQAVLVKLGIPEERMKYILAVMACASNNCGFLSPNTCLSNVVFDLTLCGFMSPDFSNSEAMHTEQQIHQD